jgi:hypothetical protein
VNSYVVTSLGVGNAPRAKTSVRMLADSGFAVLTVANWRVIAEVGGPGPREHAGHSHAGTLGFELTHNKDLVFVDTGVSTYSGPRRRYERSTAAHNTLSVGGLNTSSVWSDFRTARPADAAVTSHGTTQGRVHLTATARLGGRLSGFVHKRTWRLERGGLEVEDILLGHGKHLVAAYFHWASTQVPLATATGATTDSVSFDVRADGMRVDTTPLSPDSAIASDFGKLSPSALSVVNGQVVLPCRIRTTIRTRPT